MTTLKRRRKGDSRHPGPSMFSRAATSTRAPCFVHPRHNARILRVGFATAHARRSFPKRAPDKIDYNPFPAFGDSSQADTVAVAYRRVTANELESHAAPPTRVKMLVRDFIEDSLYNPNYGYFSKQATIFSAIDKPIEFGRMRDGAEFQEEVASRYTEYGMDNQDGPGRQIWHTPTELFQVCTTFAHVRMRLTSAAVLRPCCSSLHRL
jgi:hypothetical protein